jgi:hypothetical protein
MLMMRDAGITSRSDALQLAALTSLTQLDLVGAVGVDDVAATVLALRLTRLQDLRLTNCGLRSAAALPAIATLTGLTNLGLGVLADDGTTKLPLGQEDLLLLTPLTQLKQLWNHSFFHSVAVSRLWSTQKRWLQPPPAWLCRAHAPQQQE